MWVAQLWAKRDEELNQLREENRQLKFIAETERMKARAAKRMSRLRRSR